MPAVSWSRDLRLEYFVRLNIERRIFYEATGALRDMIQSHLLQMLALETMEQPKTMNQKDERLEKIKL